MRVMQGDRELEQCNPRLNLAGQEEKNAGIMPRSGRPCLANVGFAPIVLQNSQKAVQLIFC